jgi:hypothetical protein
MPIRTVTASRTARFALLFAMLSVVGGCASGGGGNASFAQADGPTVAFESIDGPPPQIFDRMVNLLDSEAKLRNLAVVSREGAAAYRVRSYLAAQIRGGKTTVAWVWDVYDRDQQRALRLTGEEQTGKSSGRDAWAAADDLVLRRIAQAGLSGLSGMINGTTSPDPTPPPVPPAPGRRGPAIASTEGIPAQSAAFGPSVTSFTTH